MTIGANSTLIYDPPSGNIICSVAIRITHNVVSKWACQSNGWSVPNPIGCGGFILWVHNALSNARIDYT
jgi:hypothetical protein